MKLENSDMFLIVIIIIAIVVITQTEHFGFVDDLKAQAAAIAIGDAKARADAKAAAIAAEAKAIADAKAAADAKAKAKADILANFKIVKPQIYLPSLSAICKSDKTLINGFCYDNCPVNYTRDQVILSKCNPIIPSTINLSSPIPPMFCEKDQKFTGINCLPNCPSNYPNRNGDYCSQ
jgi:hypothetical protein